MTWKRRLGSDNRVGNSNGGFDKLLCFLGGWGGGGGKATPRQDMKPELIPLMADTFQEAVDAWLSRQLTRRSCEVCDLPVDRRRHIAHLPHRLTVILHAFTVHTDAKTWLQTRDLVCTMPQGLPIGGNFLRTFDMGDRDQVVPGNIVLMVVHHHRINVFKPITSNHRWLGGVYIKK